MLLAVADIMGIVRLSTDHYKASSRLNIYHIFRWGNLIMLQAEEDEYTSTMCIFDKNTILYQQFFA